MIDWLESRLGFLAIPRFIRMIAALNLLVYLLYLLQREYVQLLTLDPFAVIHGQVWRLVSYIFIPEVVFQSGSPVLQLFFLFIYLSLMVWIGDALEEAWGAFKLNLYYLLGMIGVTVAAFLLFFVAAPTDIQELVAVIRGVEVMPFYINLSLFFAFATIFPNLEILVMFILPVKVKWLALISLAGVLFAFLTGPIVTKVAIVISFANYGFFFFPTLFANAGQKAKVQKRRFKFAAHSVPADEPIHRCSVCNKTEKDNPDLEFRVARDGEEYCTQHLPQAVD